MLLASTGSSFFGSSANRAAASASISTGRGGGGGGGGAVSSLVAVEMDCLLTGGRASAGLGTVKICWQPGHLPFLPASPSLTTIARLQWGQVNLIGMIGSVRGPGRLFKM